MEKRHCKQKWRNARHDLSYFKQSYDPTQASVHADHCSRPRCCKWPCWLRRDPNQCAMLMIVMTHQSTTMMPRQQASCPSRWIKCQEWHQNSPEDEITNEKSATHHPCNDVPDRKFWILSICILKVRKISNFAVMPLSPKPLSHNQVIHVSSNWNVVEEEGENEEEGEEEKEEDETTFQIHVEKAQEGGLEEWRRVAASFEGKKRDEEKKGDKFAMRKEKMKNKEKKIKMEGIGITKSPQMTKSASNPSSGSRARSRSPLGSKRQHGPGWNSR